MFVLTAIVSAICISFAVGHNVISNSEHQRPLRNSHSVFVDFMLSRKFLCKAVPWERNRILDNSKVCDGTGDCPYGEDEICTKCEEPPHVSSGYPTGSQTHFPVGATVEYECRPGYIFKDVSSVVWVVCTGLGFWTKAPVCERLCDALPILGNGRLIAREPLTPGDIVAVACNDGYIPVGITFLTCAADGFWIGHPSCVLQPKQCEAIPEVLNGVVDTNNAPLKEGAVVTFTCKKGYAPKTNNLLRCDSTGTWLGTPECVKVTVCPASSLPTGLPLVFNAQQASPAVVGDQPVGNVVNYVCTSGLSPFFTSAMAFSCSSTGSWIGNAECL
ncbi:hypothetical protein DPMN_148685 [Dreissena polymorpha]|uniref:Sushi domain-containing protein n=1 Tax=Dreissena polymorpha TaxID=45954 RepID=A0A9D4J485_DREPO|nr:hypothetical protein DPMN_148685 [Dreissena polymorpha]